MIFAIDNKIEIKFGSFFEISDKCNLKVGHFKQVKVVHLLFNGICDFSFDYLILNKNFSNCLLVFIDDVHLARQAAMLHILDIYVHSRITKTHRLRYIIFGEMNFHIFFQRDKLQLQRWQFFGKWKDEGLFPGIVLCLICGFAAAFLSVVCESRINWRLFWDVFELCLPES